MYEAFFGMEHTPFVRDVPPEKLYESSAFRETLGRLSYVADRQMFAVVTADSGCGKSTLIRRFYSELPKEDYIVLYLSDSKLTPRWFYKGLLDQLGLESRFYRGDSKRQLQQEIEISRKIFGIPVFKHNSSFRSIDGSGTWDEWLAPARPLDASHRIDAQVIDSLLRDIKENPPELPQDKPVCTGGIIEANTEEEE